MIKNQTRKTEQALRTEHRRRVTSRTKAVFVLLAIALLATETPAAATGGDSPWGPVSEPETPASADEPSESGAGPSDPGASDILDELLPEAVTSVGIGSELVTTTSGGLTVALSIDSATTSDRATLDTGDTILQDVIGDVDLTIRPLDAGFAVVAKIESIRSTHQLRFDAILPTGSILELADDGSIDVVGEDGFTIGTFKAPWATDASGNSINTYYTLDGATIVQVIEPTIEAEYPLMADPEWNWGWVSGTIYFNRSETYQICHQPLNAVSILMLLITELIRRIPRVGRIIALIPGGIGAIASIVDQAVCSWFLGNVQLCLKIKIRTVPPDVSPGSHWGSYCT